MLYLGSVPVPRRKTPPAVVTRQLILTYEHAGTYDPLITTLLLAY